MSNSLMEAHIEQVREQHAEMSAIDLHLMWEKSRQQASDPTLSTLAKSKAQAEADLFYTMAREKTPVATVETQIETLREEGDNNSADSLEYTRQRREIRQDIRALQDDLCALEQQPDGAIRDSRIKKLNASIDAKQKEYEQLRHPAFDRFNQAKELRQQAAQERDQGTAENLRRDAWMLDRGQGPSE